MGKTAKKKLLGIQKRVKELMKKLIIKEHKVF